MATKYGSVTDLFTAIANSIRAKKGVTDMIVADDFPTEIDAIKSEPVETEEVSVALNMANGDMVIAPTVEGKLLSKVTVKKPNTLIPDNIAKDINIGGIIGALAGGGDIKIATGTAKGDKYNYTTVNHNLGVVPDLFFIFRTTMSVQTGCILYAYGISSALKSSLGENAYNGSELIASDNGYKWYGGTAVITSTSTAVPINSATTTSVRVGNSSYKLSGGDANYYWIAIAGLV